MQWYSVCLSHTGIISEKGEEEGEPPEDMFAFDEDVPFGGVAASDPVDETDEMDPAPSAGDASVPAGLTPLERAKALALSLGMNKPSASSSSSSAPSPMLPAVPVTSDGKIDTRAALQRAKMIAMQMGGGGGANAAGAGETEMHYMEELEINDYPPQVMICYYILITSFGGLTRVGWYINRPVRKLLNETHWMKLQIAPGSPSSLEGVTSLPEGSWRWARGSCFCSLRVPRRCK